MSDDYGGDPGPIVYLVYFAIAIFLLFAWLSEGAL